MDLPVKPEESIPAPQEDNEIIQDNTNNQLGDDPRQKEDDIPTAQEQMINEKLSILEPGETPKKEEPEHGEIQDAHVPIQNTQFESLPHPRHIEAVEKEDTLDFQKEAPSQYSGHKRTHAEANPKGHEAKEDNEILRNGCCKR